MWRFNYAFALMELIIVTSGLMALSLQPVFAAGFIDDALLSGNVFYWQRQHDRKELDPASEHAGDYRANLHHATLNSNLDYQSGYAAEWLGFDFALYGAAELASSGPAAPNEIGFSKARNCWDEKWDGDTSSASVYKAALRFKYRDYWLRAGYIQPTGQTLIAPHWSFLPGTYRGFEAGAIYDFGQRGSFSYLWSDKYKAPWYRELYKFWQADSLTDIRYMHSVGVKYDFKIIWY